MKRLVLALAMLLLAGTVAQAQQFPGVMATDLTCTASPTFVPLPGLIRTITHSSAGTPTIVSVSVEIVTMTVQQAIRIRVLVNGVPIPSGVPNDGVQFAFLFYVDPDQNPAVNTANVGVRTFTSVTEPLLAGAHTVTVEWRVSFKHEFGPVCIHTRTLVVAP